MWSLKVLLRYILLQLPVLILLMIIYFLSRQFKTIPSFFILVILIVWLVKDIVMYPFVWKAYIQEDIKESASMLGKKGKAITDINPTGTVEIKGEIWKAKSLEEKSPIRKKDTVRVVEVQGLTLIIKSCSKSS